MDAVPKELAFAVEGARGGNTIVRISYFSVISMGKLKGAALHGDTNQVGGDWLDIETLLYQPVYPSKLRKQNINPYHSGKI
jgi:hypothetical protein